MDLITYASPFGPGSVALESGLVTRHIWGEPAASATGMIAIPAEPPNIVEVEPRLAAALADYYSGRPTDLSRWATIDLDGISEFAARVYRAATTLKWGTTATYSDIAALIGRPRAVRAVGTALGKNPAPLFIPCHRVISKDGLGGWSGPRGLKEKLLRLEGRTARANGSPWQR